VPQIKRVLSDEKLRQVVRRVLSNGHRRARRRPSAPSSPRRSRGRRLVASLIESLGPEPVTLVGNATGGAIAQFVAVRRTELLERLALVGSDAFEACPPGRVRPWQAITRMAGGNDPGRPDLAFRLRRSNRRLPRFGRLPPYSDIAWLLPGDAGESGLHASPMLTAPSCSTGTAGSVRSGPDGYSIALWPSGSYPSKNSPISHSSV
jgi:pimeloyl-ACP methyl ester carboxylesterase